MKITSTSGDLEMRRHFGVAVVGVDRNAGQLVDNKLFGKRHADALGHAAFDLAFRRQAD